MPDLHGLGLSEIAAALRQGDLTAVAVTHWFLDRIERFDPTLQSYIHVAKQEALEAATLADRKRAAGGDLGLLHGVPIAIKDVIAVAGMPYTGGSLTRAHMIAETDAPSVRDLRLAGVIILGKLSTHELGIGRSQWSGPFPTGRNPWNISRVTTGSSSGAGAAVAGGLAAGALGTDTAGSVRLPSAHCGLTGLKPTFGRVSTEGMLAMCPSLDHVGPVAHSATDVRLLMKALTGSAQYEGEPAPMRGAKIGVLRRYYGQIQQVDGDVLGPFECMLDVLRDQGVHFVDVDLPLLGGAEAMFQPYMAESYEFHHELLRASPEKFEIGTRSQLYLGALISAADYLAAEQARRSLATQVDSLLADCIALIHPGQPVAAPVYSEALPKEVISQRVRFTVPWNLTGHPALTFPTGFATDRLPVSAQLVGRRNDEATLLDIAEAFQGATSLHRMRPNEASWTGSPLGDAGA